MGYSLRRKSPRSTALSWSEAKVKTGMYRTKREAAASLGCLSLAGGLLWAILIALVGLIWFGRCAFDG